MSEVQEVSVEQPSLHNARVEAESAESKPFFKAEPRIYRDDGWLSDKGIFYGCGPDQHDACASYIMERKYPGVLEELERKYYVNSPFSTVRWYLGEMGYAQINHKHVLPPAADLTGIQLERINDRGLSIEKRFGDMARDDVLKRLTVLKVKLERDKLSKEQQDLVEEFFRRGCYFTANDDPESARLLFETLSAGLEKGGSYENRPDRGYSREWCYRFTPDMSIGLELINHRHDGWSGLKFTSWVTAMSYEDMISRREAVGGGFEGRRLISS